MTTLSFSSPSPLYSPRTTYQTTSPADMSSTSLGNPFPTDSRPMNGLASNTGRDKSISLRSAAVMDVSAGKNASGERVWRSGVVTAEDKLVGVEGQKVVVAAW